MLTVKTVTEGSRLPSEWSIGGLGSDPHQVPGTIILGGAWRRVLLEYILEGPLFLW